jgi:hypothetical protein
MAPKKGKGNKERPSNRTWYRRIPKINTATKGAAAIDKKKE